MQESSRVNGSATTPDPLAKCLLTVSMTLGFAGLDILVPKKGMLPLGDTPVSLN